MTYNQGAGEEECEEGEEEGAEGSSRSTTTFTVVFTLRHDFYDQQGWEEEGEEGEEEGGREAAAEGQAEPGGHALSGPPHLPGQGAETARHSLLQHLYK